MTRSETIRHNAKILLGAVRGKSKAERQSIYRMVAGGPIGMVAHIASAIVASHTKIEAQIKDFDAEHEKVMQQIERGARSAMANEWRFRL